MSTICLKGGSTHIFYLAKKARAQHRPGDRVLGHDNNWYIVYYIRLETETMAIIFHDNNQDDLSCQLLPTRYDPDIDGLVPNGSIGF
ncbi:MAG: hypothetical protein AAB372_02070 [Patescibacteria group bacterium]